MRKSNFKAEDFIGSLNTVKTGFQMRGIPFTKEAILKAIKGIGLPTNGAFWKAFREEFLQEVSRGKFMFRGGSDPIPIGYLIHAYNNYRKISKTYQDTYRGKKGSKKAPLKEGDVINLTPETVETLPVSSVEESKISSAIEFLKDRGYKVLAPVGIIYKMI